MVTDGIQQLDLPECLSGDYQDNLSSNTPMPAWGKERRREKKRKVKGRETNKQGLTIHEEGSMLVIN